MATKRNIAGVPAATSAQFGGLAAWQELPLRRMLVAAVDGLKNLNLWLVFPDHEDDTSYFGAAWYKPLWNGELINKYGLGGMDFMDKLLGAVPCGPSSHMLQAGAHLGIYALASAAAGCHAWAIEGFRLHSHYAAMSAALNGVSHLYHPINAIVGPHESPAVPFGGFDMSVNTTKTVPMVTIDGIARAALADPASVFPIVIIDVEGFEEGAMAGASELLASGKVLFWNIEVWAVKDGVRRSSFPYLAELVRAGYSLVWIANGFVHIDEPYENFVALARSQTSPNSILDVFAVSKHVPQEVFMEILSTASEPVYRKKATH